jgi:ABC-type polysaccharide/polyol phosphate transport system ATPase subunit
VSALSRGAPHASSITVADLGKVYHLYANPRDRLLEAIHPFRKQYHTDFHALAGLSFEVRRGETVGIIGKNGSGKSTLLKVLTGVLTPTHGEVHVRGRVSALLELGMGFNPEISGLENVYFTGAILGIPRAAMEAKLPDILAFADIGEYVRQPVKSYSSGMFVRLAFAVAIHVEPEVLIVDEALSVGDMRFQQKCYRKIRSFKESGTTILFVSHDTGAIINFCDRCIWLKDGKIERDGVPAEVVREYIAHMAFDVPTARAAAEPPKLAEGPQWVDVSGLSSFGDRGAEIVRVALLDAATGAGITVLEGGEEVVYAMELVYHHDIDDLIYGLALKDSYGNQIVTFNTLAYGHAARPRRAGERVVVRFAFRFPLLGNRDYTFSPAVAEGTQDSHVAHHWVHDATLVQVAKNDARRKFGAALALERVDFEES